MTEESSKPTPNALPVIVIADDDVDTLNIVKTKFEAHGIQVVTSRDGYDALRVVRDRRPAVAIIDVMMPRLNGFQVARMIKFDKNVKETPVILLTARTQQADRDMGTHVHASDYVTKPFDPQQLLEKVQTYIARKQHTEAGA